MARPLRFVTWNINSVRLRAEQVARFVADEGPDVLCLQEIKCRDADFPAKIFAEVGLRHLHIVGQKGWHGVAIASRLPLEPLTAPDLCPRGEARIAAARVEGVSVHSVYVPAGGDEADPELNPKFAHKLEVLARMRRLYEGWAGGPLILAGDLNVAPGEHDVWSHAQLLRVVSHTPIETQALEAARTDAGLVDLARQHRPAPEKLFTWWSYRSPDWAKADRGRRLDHLWASPDLAARSGGFRIHAACRGWDRPSDHAPVAVDVLV